MHSIDKGELSEIELRASGDSISGTKYYFSTDEGNTWEEITSLKSLMSVSGGENIQLRIEINSASTQIKAWGILYNVQST